VTNFAVHIEKYHEIMLVNLAAYTEKHHEVNMPNFAVYTEKRNEISVESILWIEKRICPFTLLLERHILQQTQQKL
jgi:hypothetical protein